MPLYEGVRLKSLPNAEREAEEIAEVLECPGDFLCGHTATRSAMLLRLRKAGIAHLATHGLLSLPEGEYMPGGLALAPDSENGDDGLVYANDILKHRNPSLQLVILVEGR